MKVFSLTHAMIVASLAGAILAFVEASAATLTGNSFNDEAQRLCQEHGICPNDSCLNVDGRDGLNFRYDQYGVLKGWITFGGAGIPVELGDSESASDASSMRRGHETLVEIENAGHRRKSVRQTYLALLDIVGLDNSFKSGHEQVYDSASMGFVLFLLRRNDSFERSHGALLKSMVVQPGDNDGDVLRKQRLRAGAINSRILDAGLAWDFCSEPPGIKE